MGRFEVDREGLRKMAKELGPSKVFIEVISNALDEEGVTKVDITVEPIPNRAYCHVVVEDDSPNGFLNLSHAYTIFAESYKRGNPEQRGQFNLGEKYFLALCETATIATTTGMIVFDGDGRHEKRQKRDQGTVIEAVYELKRDDLAELNGLVDSLILPEEISVTFNGELLQSRSPIHEVTVPLPTKISDEEGGMRPTIRSTKVSIYECKAGEVPKLYEMGIPVVDTDIRWDVSVGQKVPLNKDRDNVTPAYNKKVCTLVAEAMVDHLDQDDANTWANESLEDENISDDLRNKILDEKFGKNRVTFDPNDLEANIRAATEGATVVTGRMLSKKQWGNVKNNDSMSPSSKDYGTAKPWSDSPNAKPADFIEQGNWTDGMRITAGYATYLGKELMNVDLRVRFAKKMSDGRVLACYSQGHHLLEFNMQRVGRSFFADGITEEVERLLIHEFGHEYAGNHFSEEYYDALCMLGCKFKALALNKPDELMKAAKGELDIVMHEDLSVGGLLDGFLSL